MAVLTRRDLENIHRTGGIAVDCATRGDLRDELLRHIQTALSASSGVFTQILFEDGRRNFVAGFSRGVPDGALETWCRDYQSIDPFVRHFMQRVEAGGERVVVSSNVVRNRDYVRSAFYCDFLRPQSVHHVMVAGLVRRSEIIAVLGLHRPRQAAPFSSTDILKMNLILPHLEAAVEKVNLMEQLSARQCIIDTLAQDLSRSAVLMLDQQYRLLLANECAASLLGLRADQGETAAALPDEIHRGCESLRSHAAADGCRAREYRLDFVARIDGKEMRGAIRAYADRPHDPRFIVYFGPPCRSLARPERMDALGLSSRESEIVHLVSCGLSNQQIAARLAISVRTVENHLRSIYAKVNVHSRTGLVAQVAGQ
jgi:DNA-binding CsgD family transcriptional regulator